MNLKGRYLLLCTVYALCIYQDVHCQAIDKIENDQENKQTDQIIEKDDKYHANIETSNGIDLSVKRTMIIDIFNLFI